MSQTIYSALVQAKENREKKIAVLIDPDQIKQNNIDRVLQLASTAGVDYIFLGGSLVVSDMMSSCIKSIRNHIDVPVILFPGDISQINHEADALLFLSLISGRNPDLLIGKHIVAAPLLKKSPLEVISTGYMLFDGGNVTTAIYMSGSLPIPVEKIDIAVCTAMAGEMLGLKMIYMDAGSGAKQPIPENMIASVSQNITIPLIVGGGIKTPEKALANVKAGADVIVVGNAFEKDPSLIFEIAEAVHSQNRIYNS
ncbi:MAG: geranylgeranylglyceryl/heptaprenylglyceryl phosphate synthase [Saprospiraceae bacterium]